MSKKKNKKLTKRLAEMHVALLEALIHKGVITNDEYVASSYNQLAFDAARKLGIPTEDILAATFKRADGKMVLTIEFKEPN